ncbi:MAG: transglutaminase domain-containing protein [Promethearchaeota archaeon]|nr:MAG: transglutaminase domain-containing protein [Candidatus Lokiarchaeota archaeon]
MKIRIHLANRIHIRSGMLQAGYLAWSLYGVSENQSVLIESKTPPFQIREMGEQNFAGFIKLPALKANDEFPFKITLLFSTKNLQFPIINFKFNSYPKSFLSQYCRGTKFWEVNDPDLMGIAKTLRTESGDDVLSYLRNTYNFVQKNIKFRENQDQRFGARRALQEGKGDCDEFSDLFITLCRISHIPARRIIGVLLTGSDTFSLHAWAEVYIPLYRIWVPFDAALNEFASIKWNYLLRAHVGLKNEMPLIWFKSKVGKNFHAEFEASDISQISVLPNNSSLKVK